MRELLKNLLDECKQCNDYFLSHVEEITDGILTDEQIEWVIVKLNDRHQAHEEAPARVQ